MKISILLPYKENFSSSYAGAVSLFLNDVIKISKYKKFIKIYGCTNYKKDLLSNKYINIPIKKNFFQSSTKKYLNIFLKHENLHKSNLVEIHNRPNYLKKIFEVNKNIVLYFHNDPLSQKGSKLIKERVELLKKTKKIIFISKWVKDRFFLGLENFKNKKSNYEVIPHSTNKINIDIKKKKQNIIFIGRLNASKGYDIFGKAILQILDKHKNWKAYVYGDEPRENIIFKHKNLKILGFKKHHEILNKLKISSISVSCSRWEEPFGRTALEASSRGCAVIISNRGGLPEAASYGVKMSNLEPKTLFKAIDKLILDKNYRYYVQKVTLKKFKLTNDRISKNIDNYRKKLFKS
tara:strand:+ start:1741 stop:2790 length:1050 start_codon:yes stop_codon:yes gene_type:complete